MSKKVILCHTSYHCFLPNIYPTHRDSSPGPAQAIPTRIATYPPIHIDSLQESLNSNKLTL